MHTVVYSAHHASDSFAFADFDGRCALTSDQRMRFSDFGTRETVPRNGAVLLSTHSRGLVDLNRSPDDPTLFPQKDFGRDERRSIWLPGKEPTAHERARIFDAIYRPYHDRILEVLKHESQPTLLIAWDNTAPYEDYVDANGHPRNMPSFVLSNNGDAHVGTAAIDAPERRVTTCDARLLEHLQERLKRHLSLAGLPDDVQLNTYDPAPNNECGYIANQYSSLRNPLLPVTAPVQSMQVEYNTNLTHDPVTLARNERAMNALRNAFEQAVEEVLA